MSNSATPALDAQGMLRSTIASQPEGLLTINEVAAWLGVSKAWVYDHATRKKPFLPCVRFGELTRIPLGLKSEMDRGEAKAKLREIIARETKDILPAPVSVTLRWFYENRFLPQKEQQWKVTSRPKTKRFIENYLLKRFGDTLLGDLDRFTLQTYLNEMAPKYSRRVLSKIRVYFNSMLDEAVELEMLPKNPAGKLAVPKSGKRKTTKHLTPEEIPQILFHLSDRDRLIVRYGAAHERQGRAGPPPTHERQDDAGALHQICAGERPRCRRIARSVVEEEAELFRNASELNPFEPNSMTRPLVRV